MILGMNTVIRVGFQGIWGMYILGQHLLASQKGLAALSYDVMELVDCLIN